MGDLVGSGSSYFLYNTVCRRVCPLVSFHLLQNATAKLLLTTLSQCPFNPLGKNVDSLPRRVSFYYCHEGNLKKGISLSSGEKKGKHIKNIRFRIVQPD
jgi:hypothetical protein